MSQTPVWELARYRPFVRLLARGLIRDFPDLNRLDQAKLVNDVLLKAHQGLAQFRGNSEDDLLNWLRAILVNEFRTVCRREVSQARDPALEQALDNTLTRSSVRLGAFLEASQSSPSEIAQPRAVTFALAAALETLPKDEYEMLVAHDLEGESFRDIGTRLGVNSATVLTRVRQVRQKLQRVLSGNVSEVTHGR